MSFREKKYWRWRKYDLFHSGFSWRRIHVVMRSKTTAAVLLLLLFWMTGAILFRVHNIFCWIYWSNWYVWWLISMQKYKYNLLAVIAVNNVKTFGAYKRVHYDVLCSILKLKCCILQNLNVCNKVLFVCRYLRQQISYELYIFFLISLFIKLYNL